jgi:hypothetical protein
MLAANWGASGAPMGSRQPPNTMWETKLFHNSTGASAPGHAYSWSVQEKRYNYCFDNTVTTE